jgi:hypothetical protein
MGYFQPRVGHSVWRRQQQCLRETASGAETSIRKGQQCGQEKCGESIALDEWQSRQYEQTSIM